MYSVAIAINIFWRLFQVCHGYKIGRISGLTSCQVNSDIYNIFFSSPPNYGNIHNSCPDIKRISIHFPTKHKHLSIPNVGANNGMKIWIIEIIFNFWLISMFQWLLGHCLNSIKFLHKDESYQYNDYIVSSPVRAF